MIRQERLIDAFQHITSLRKENPPPILSDLLLTRLEEVEQLFRLHGRGLPRFLQSEVFGWALLQLTLGIIVPKSSWIVIMLIRCFGIGHVGIVHFNMYM